MRRPDLRAKLAPLLITTLLSISPVCLHAQGTFEGVVADSVTGEPVSQARVMLPELGRAVTSDRLGGFRLEGVPGGIHRVRIERVGYRAWEEQVGVEAASAGTHVFELVPDPLPVSGVTASVPSANWHLMHFERRRKHHRASGHFITQEHLAKRESSRLSDVLRSVPGVRILRSRNEALVATGHTPPGVFVPGQQGRACLTQVFVDGIKLYGMRAVGSDPPVDIDLFDVRNIAAVEFYSGASSTPVEFRTNSAQCGTLAIWSRMR